MAAFADTLQITVKELVAANLQALLNHLGGVLIHAVVGSEAKDVINSAASVSRGSVFADVLNAPVSKLALGNDIDASKDLVDARTLCTVSDVSLGSNEYHVPYLPQDSSRICSVPPSFPSRQAQPRATSHEEPR